MQTFGKKFKGQQDQAGGVMAMLEVILSDFSNEQADTEAAEAKAQETYDDFTAESKLQEDTKDLKGTQDELIAADRYYEKLVPQCIDQGQTFEERTASRESEIASLKQALEILSSR